MRDDRLLRHGMRRGGDGEGHALGQPRPDLIEHGAKASALAEGCRGQCVPGVRSAGVAATLGSPVDNCRE